MTGTSEKDAAAAERCRKKSEFYASKFQDIQPMSSTELAQAAVIENSDNSLSYVTDDGVRLVLVDVRSHAERSVSMIPGAISLAEFENHQAVAFTAEDAAVVCYCTIGYRSGLECRRLRQKYYLRDRIRNLDGIISFTHVDPLVIKGSSSGSPEKLQLIQPDSKETTRYVHVFGPNWKCAHSSYEAKHFPLPAILLRSTGVGILSVGRYSQYSLFVAKKWCYSASCCRKNHDYVATSALPADAPDTVLSKTEPMEISCKTSQFL